MYNEKNIKKKVFKILKKNSYNRKKVYDESLLTSDLGIDSLGFISVIADLEDELGIEVQEEELVYLSDTEKEMTAGFMVELVKKWRD